MQHALELYCHTRAQAHLLVDSDVLINVNLAPQTNESINKQQMRGCMHE